PPGPLPPPPEVAPDAGCCPFAPVLPVGAGDCVAAGAVVGGGEVVGGVVVGGEVVGGGSFACCWRRSSSLFDASTSAFCLSRTSSCAFCTAERACWHAETCWGVGGVVGSLPIGAHIVVAVPSALSAVAMATSTACCAAMTACCALAIAGSGDAVCTETNRAVGFAPDRDARKDAFVPPDDPPPVPALAPPLAADWPWPESALSSVSWAWASACCLLARSARSDAGSSEASGWPTVTVSPTLTFTAETLPSIGKARFACDAASMVAVPVSAPSPDRRATTAV